MKDKLIKYASWLFMLLFACVGVYFIMLNATWLIGDDDIVIIHTGMGKFYDPAYNIWPKSGRFFPLSYVMYNVLPLLTDGYITANTHYIFHSLIFVLLGVVLMQLVSDLLKEQKTIYRYGIALCSTIFILARVYQTFVYCWATTWFDSLLTVTIIASYYLFMREQKWGWALGSFILMVFQTYCVESAFVVPLALGTCGLTLRWRECCRTEKIFYGALIGNAVIFLVVYYVVCFLHTTHAYDPAHGSGDTFFYVVKKILLSQKFIWPALIVMGVRCWDVLFRKSKVTMFDLMLLTAAAYCWGGWILKLNWVLYYHKVVIWALLPVLYYGLYYLKAYWTLLMMAVFALFYVAKMPGQIKECQAWRIDSAVYTEALKKIGESGQNIYWVAPLAEDGTLAAANNAWILGSIQNTMRYVMHDESVEISILDEYSNETGYVIFQAGSDRSAFPLGEKVAHDHHYGVEIYELVTNQ